MVDATGEVYGRHCVRRQTLLDAAQDGYLAAEQGEYSAKALNDPLDQVRWWWASRSD